jgi:hypothetical protein
VALSYATKRLTAHRRNLLASEMFDERVGKAKIEEATVGVKADVKSL